MKNLPLIILACFLAMNSIIAQSQLPEINIITTYIDQGSEILYIEYSIVDQDDTEFTVDVLLSNDGGQRFDFVASSANGDIGDGIINNGPKEIMLGVTGLDPMLAVARLIVSDNDTLDIQSIVDQVDMNRIKENLIAVQGIRHRNGDQAHVDSVRALISSKLNDAGPEPTVYSFMFGGYEAKNIIGNQQGIANPHAEYYVGGHYDSVINSPGADDNGTAVAAMLEVAQVLGGLPFDKTIRYVSWDLEESGLVGSMDYVNNVLENEDDIEGYLNMEMIGYFKEEPNTQTLPAGFNLLFPAAYSEIEANDFRGDFLTNVGNTANSLSLMTTFEEIASQYVPELSVISVASPGTGAAVPDLLRSDHASFWLKSIPAVMLTDGANFRNPHYHTVNDVVDSLDMEFLANNTKAVVAFLAAKSDYNHADVVDIDSITVISNTEAVENNNKISVFPVPADDVITIQMNDVDFAKIETIAIYSESGKLVRSISRNELNQSESAVSTKELIPGIYFIRASLDGQLLSNKFVVLH